MKSENVHILLTILKNKRSSAVTLGNKHIFEGSLKGKPIDSRLNKSWFRHRKARFSYRWNYKKSWDMMDQKMNRILA